MFKTAFFLGLLVSFLCYFLTLLIILLMNGFNYNTNDGLEHIALAISFMTGVITTFGSLIVLKLNYLIKKND